MMIYQTFGAVKAEAVIKWILAGTGRRCDRSVVDLPTCGRVVCRAAQQADGIRKVDLLQLELSLHVDSG